MTSTNTAAKDPAGHDWREAGAAWGHAAVDWACLYEHYAVEVLAAMSAATGVGNGVDVVDVACGAGYAMRFMRGCGANVSGLDAAEALVAIARHRNPDADVRVGSMFALPWPDASFDVALSVNGIWGHCGDALVEMRRVLRPGGKIGISFWGDGKSGAPLDMRPVFVALAALTPPAGVDGMRNTNRIAKPGVAEEMLREAGFEVIERGSRVAVLEWPDEDIAWRSLASCGPMVPALEHSGPDVVRRDVLAAMAPLRNANGMYEYRNDHQFVIARAV
jgi:SAM-dependent methyltransferase